MSDNKPMDINEFDEFLDELEESLEEASTPRGVAVAKAVVEFGFPIFVEGLSATERFFKAAPGKKNKDAQTTACDLAMKKIKNMEEKGLIEAKDRRKPRFSLRIRFVAEGAKKIQDGDLVEAGWKDDLAETSALWTRGSTDRTTGEVQPSALGEFHIPSLKNFGLMHESEIWCLIGITPDPYKLSLGEEGKTDEYEGEARYPMIRYISQVFGTADEAYASLAGAAEGGATGEFPPEYGNKAAWNKVAKMISKELDDGLTVEEAAEKYEVDVAYVEPLHVPL